MELDLDQIAYVICRVRQPDTCAVSGHLGFLARYYICELQPVRGVERNSVHAPVAFCAIGIVWDFPDFRIEPTV
jgi:hypothetical protein